MTDTCDSGLMFAHEDYIPCPTTRAQFLSQSKNPRGCRFTVGAGTGFVTPTVDFFAKDATGGVFGPPLRYWDGKKFLAVGKAVGHGFYYCPPPDLGFPICVVAADYNKRFHGFADWLFVAPAGAVSKVHSLPNIRTRVPSSFRFNTDLNGRCLKAQIQSAYIPSLGKTLVGPPEETGRSDVMEGDRRGWCVWIHDKA
eukprot:jgi/Mesvir1/18044/Mv09361-RA.1